MMTAEGEFNVKMNDRCAFEDGNSKDREGWVTKIHPKKQGMPGKSGMYTFATTDGGLVTVHRSAIKKVLKRANPEDE